MLWRNVSRSRRCPICHHDSYCSVSEELGVCCRRVATGREHKDANGAPYWVHPIGGDRPDAPPAKPIVPCASRQQVAAVYWEILVMLRLSRPHLADLRARGLTPAEISRREYRSLHGYGRAGLARRLVDRHGEQVCAGVPGLYRHEEDGRSWWSLAGAAGLLIPVRDLSGAIRALTIRADDPDRAGKYTVLSSKSHGGPGPGAPIHVPLVSGTGNPSTVRITEGHLKADVATALSGVLTLGLPGLHGWRAALAVLEDLRPATVLLAFDADAGRNPHVARSLAKGYRFLRGAGFNVELEEW